MADNAEVPLNTPKEDAERIRLKRLAKLQSAAASTSTSASASTSNSRSPTPASASTTAVASSKSTPPAIPKPPTSVKRPSPTRPTGETPPLKKKTAPAPANLDLPIWEHQTIISVLKVTLEGDVAANSGHDIVWLKSLAKEIMDDEPGSTAPPRLTTEHLDRLLMARLELDPTGMSDDLDYLPVLVSLPAGQTPFEYLVGCWKRINSTRSILMKKQYIPAQSQHALAILDKIRELVVNYIGLALQDLELWPQPEGRVVGPDELVVPLISMAALSTPLLSSPSTSSSQNNLTPSDIPQFLTDLSSRFSSDLPELAVILGPVVKKLLLHPSLFRPEGLAGGDSSWRGVIGGLEALVQIKPIAIMITTCMEDDWIPEDVTPRTFEVRALMGPLCRLGVCGSEWPQIAKAYFSEPEKRTRGDVESSFASLRGTMKSLQSSLFQIFNTFVRASSESREAVLRFFAKVIELNVKRAGMQVESTTVASDSFMINLQSVLLRFAEPFIDSTYSKIDRIDPFFYATSSRIDITEETRIKATAEEAKRWDEEHKANPGEPAPNFISNIFYLTVSMSHYGYLKTIQTYMELQKHLDELQRQVDTYTADNSWAGTPFQARMERAIEELKNQISKIRSDQFAYDAGLRDPELLFRFIGFTNFLSSWVIRQVDPKKLHPNTTVELPLPKDVPMAFRVLPEYIIEDIVDFLHFVVQTSPESLELSGRQELIIFALTFLTSTWYIKNPFLKSKINDMLFMGIWRTGRERNGILGNLLNTHPMALKHLMPALMHFYIEVEQTGASSQFYDKFNARRNIFYILKAIWDNPTHRDALNREAKNVDKFVKFINLMINDVTYLLDESLSEMAQIHAIQVEIDDKATWEAQTPEHRREREGQLRSLERHASSYTTLGKSTVELLKLFTAEAKEPFMMPEIVDRLAAMLDYNLDALAGPKYNNLHVRDPEKLKFDPKSLLKDILQVFLNLSDQGIFVQAVAGDGRSYSKELFERAAAIATRTAIMSSGDVEKLRMFVVRVEEKKATIEAEEDLGEIPDEYLDPLMFTVMRDPVLLPKSKTIVDRSTIKSHLLSDSKDPFNRSPLTIEDVIPVPELKAKIETFLSERRNKNTALDKPQEEIVHMETEDTS